MVVRDEPGEAQGPRKRVLTLWWLRDWGLQGWLLALGVVWSVRSVRVCALPAPLSSLSPALWPFGLSRRLAGWGTLPTSQLRSGVPSTPPPGRPGLVRAAPSHWPWGRVSPCGLPRPCPHFSRLPSLLSTLPLWVCVCLLGIATDVGVRLRKRHYVNIHGSFLSGYILINTS